MMGFGQGCTLLYRHWHEYSITQTAPFNKKFGPNFEEDREMGRMRENPRYNVISMRISDEERETLQEIMQTTQKSMSDIMREAMELFKSKWEKPQLENKAA